MKFKGQFEKITEATLVRFQQGGVLVGDVVTIKKNALSHPKVKEMGDNVKANIDMLMKTDLNLRVKAIKSIRGSIGDNSDGIGLGTTSAPTDFWVDVAVENAPGFTSNPVTLPIEVLDRADFGANLPSIPDSLKRPNNIVIKPQEVGAYEGGVHPNQNPTKNTTLKHSKGAISESIEDIYAGMNQGPVEPQHTEQNVAVRIPMENTEEFKTLLDNMGITWSVVGDNRFELHGKMEDIQAVIDKTTAGCGCNCDEVAVEVITPQEPEVELASQQIPTDTGIPNVQSETENIEEAYNQVHGEVTTKGYTIAIANAFADNVTTYLASENINHEATVDGNVTLIGIRSRGTADDIRSDLQSNVMGDMTYLRVYDTQSQA